MRNKGRPMKTFWKLSGACAALAVTAALTTGGALADHVIPDDLIVQGSLCVGFDCTANMAFNFDTIVLRENNLRILFEDTSAGSFPSNDWRIVVNGTDTGNFFAIHDAGPNGHQIFRVEAGAPNASIRVDSSGRLGLRTATPVLDVHMNTSNTPAIRMEQNSGGGFTAQTWDIGGNEANFFIRDVQGGSKLPFRIRPGALTSSIDIGAAGVGIGTASPTNPLHAQNNDASLFTSFINNTHAVGPGLAVRTGGTGTHKAFTVQTTTTDNLVVLGNGNVGVGTASPAARLHTTNGVRFAGVANCGSGIVSNGSGDLSCLASSRQFKTITGDLPVSVATANVMALRPQTGSYKDTPDVPEHWLIAEEVGAVDPALIGLADGKPYVVKTQNVVADLVAVVQQQQREMQRQQHEIDELKRLLVISGQVGPSAAASA